MTSPHRRIVFLSLAQHMVEVGGSPSPLPRPTPDGGRHERDRAGVEFRRLPPGTPDCDQRSGPCAVGNAEAPQTASFLPGQPRGRTVRSLAVRPLPPSHWRGACVALLEVCRSVTAVVEHIRPGAMYLDLSGLEPLYGCPVREVVQNLVDRAWSDLGLALVGGVGRNKVLAYLAARHAPPGEVFEPTSDEEWALLDTEPVMGLPGVDRRTAALLHDYGVVTVGQLARLPDRAAAYLLGGCAREILFWVRGGDSWPAVARERVGDDLFAAVTFPRDTLDYAIIIEAAHRLADRLVFSLRRRSRLARVVWIRVTHSDQRQARMMLPLGRSTSLYPEVHRAVESLLHSVLARRVRVRRLEVGLSRLVADSRQELLFPSQRDRLAQLCRSVDGIWAKYGRVVLFGDAPSLRQRWI